MASGKPQKRIASSGKVAWGAVIDIGPDPVTGSRRQRRLSAPTKRELEALIQETLTSVQKGTHVEPSKQTVRDYLEEWLTAIETTIKPSSFVRYRDIIRKAMLPELGGLRLAALTPARIQKFYSAMTKSGRSPSTIELYHNVLHRALDQAVKWRLIVANPCDSVEAPRREEAEMQTWTMEQMRTFLAATADHQWAALWRLALMTGMRRGELLALRWGDVDLEKGTLAVRRTLTRGADGLTYGEPKSRSGRRSIALPPSCVAALRRHRAKQTERRWLAGPGWQDTDLVFDGGYGGGVAPNTLYGTFKRLSAHVGLPELRFHDLRHTAATLSLGEGIHPKIVQEMLGHSDISMTLNRYSHVTMTMQREAADRLDTALGA
jgi:integrase